MTEVFVCHVVEYPLVVYVGTFPAERAVSVTQKRDILSLTYVCWCAMWPKGCDCF